jgi:hypothetical protein
VSWSRLFPAAAALGGRHSAAHQQGDSAMADKLIDYLLNKPAVTNPDGGYPINFIGCTAVPGPGATPFGQFDNALDFGTAGKGATVLTNLKVSTKRFAIRVVFQAKAAVTARQNLVESNMLPFSINLQPGAKSGEIIVSATVFPKAHGWAGATTQFGEPIKPGVWHTADLVYDNDTVGVFIDGEIVSVHAFPQGNIDLLGGNQLFIGTWVDGARDHFNGLIAAVQWFADIPPELESRLDERRQSAEWFTSYKYELIKPRLNLGAAKSAPVYEASIDAYVQPFTGGTMMYHDGTGAAFEMHGDINTFYQSFAGKAALGFLVSDEGNTTHAGGRKNIFSKGGIYWSGATHAVPVTGQIYLDYEAFGESSLIGFPVQPAHAVTGGFEQVFQGARMYCRNGAVRAHEVHGAILDKFLATGGVGTWGYPITNETDLKHDGHVIGRFSEFENCTIYWSAGTGAFEVHGDIRVKYKDMNGPAGEMGFPISDEGTIPNAPGAARYSCFQHGSILWYGSFASIIVARPFGLFLGRIDSKESEGFLMGQNDLYIRVTVKAGPNLIYNQRHPPSGDMDGHNVVDFNINIPNTIVPNSPGLVVTFGVDVWESDGGAPFGGGDDHLGVYSHDLTMANAWGLRENQGIFNSGAFAMINSITWSVKPQVNVSLLSETEKFWGVQNRGTSQISKAQYAAAFRDVDSEPEWWDVTDWLDAAFYELVVKGIAGNGNCFGMSLESIYARKGASIFSLPTNRFTNWDTVANEFNIKHCYQVGAGPIWWFVDEFLSGKTHDPKAVFERTRSEFSIGNNPVLCIAQNYDFSGAPHCILPVAWDSSSKPWKITICDPNFPNALRQLTVNPDDNTYDYDGGNKYHGGEWSGGRLHYTPWTLVNSKPRTPVWDAILLLLAGTILILGDDTETTAITDSNGNDLDAFGTRAMDMLRAAKRPDDFFVQAKGYNADRPSVHLTGIHELTQVAVAPGLVVRPPRTKGTVPGEIFMRREPATVFRPTGAGVKFTPESAQHLAVGALLADNRMQPVMNEVRAQPTMLRTIQNRTAHSVVNDAATMNKLSPALQNMLKTVAAATGTADFKHSLRGVRNGTFGYALKRGLTEMRIQAEQQNGEVHTLGASDFGSTKSIVSLTSSRDKRATVQIAHKLGVERDSVKIRFDGVGMQAGKPLSINSKPGLGGLELVGAAQTDVNMTVEATLDGKKIVRRSALPVGEGVRVKVSQVLSDSTISVSHIGQHFGPVISTRVIKMN